MKIVSLCPSLTELVFDLGAGDELVGRTDYCVHPAERVGAVEALGGTKTPDVERIVRLCPDLVLMNEEENRREDAEDLQAAGIPILNSFPRDLSGTARMVRTIAAALGREPAGEVIAEDIETRSARVREHVRGRARVPFAYLIWRKPWMAVGADTFASQLLEQAGGYNVFAEHALRYPEITTQELTQAAPALVLLGSEPFPFTTRHVAELSRSSGLPAHVFRLADGELLSWHGSRTPAGIDYAAELVAQAFSSHA